MFFASGCGTWIRTKIPASRGLCPAVRRSHNINVFIPASAGILPVAKLRLAFTLRVRRSHNIAQL